jgi:hypothetical protein
MGSMLILPQQIKNCLIIKYFLFLLFCPGAGIGRQAWLRAMCPLGRAGSIPALGTFFE